MVCPHCGTTTTVVAGRCASCAGVIETTRRHVAAGLLTPVPPSPADDVTLNADSPPHLPSTPPAEEVTRLATGSSHPATPNSGLPGGGAYGRFSASHGVGRAGTSGATPLATGQSFGTRYHIIRLLGVGGMGAVYQAWDDELGVAVAIKVIRPEITADPAAAADLERRFKRELLLARQVTHRNVVRIHDLGEIDGIKYITMPFIHGQDLASILRTVGRLPVSAALRLTRQIVDGLQAAHEAGVIHRDLKPANIMVEEEHAVIMDFGIARSAGGGGGTLLGTVVGTLEYMAPEQARAEPVDQRADLYAVGLMLSDMLVGRRHGAQAESAVAELMARMQHVPASPRSFDPAISEAVDAIVMRCLQPDPKDRYQTATELAADLDALDAQGRPLAGRIVAGVAAVRASVWRRWWKVAAALAVIAAVAIGVWLSVDRPVDRTGVVVPAQPVSLTILPFRNASDAASRNWIGTSVAEMLRAEIGQSAHVRVVSSNRVDGILRGMRWGAETSFDPPMLRQVAEFSSADTIVWGQYVAFGSEIKFTVTVEDVGRQRAVTLSASAVNEQALLETVSDLAAKIRAALALSADVVKELQATSFKPSTQSIEALRHYTEGLALVRRGQHSGAVKELLAAIAADQTFALAHSHLGQAYRTLNAEDEALSFSDKAIELSRNLPAHEQYVIQAMHARVRNDTKAALAAYQNLLEVSPEDPDVHFALASLYEATGAYQSAHDHVMKVLERDPKHLDALIRAGRIEIRRRNWQAALDRLNPALSLAIRFENEEARADALHAIGGVYRSLTKPEDALRHYRQALEIRQRLGQKGTIATTLNEIGHVQVQLGNADEGIKNFNEALKLRRDVNDRRGIGSSLNDLGVFHVSRARYDEALKYYQEALAIQRELGNVDYEALCLNNIGNVYLSKGQYADAVTYFRLSLALREKSNDLSGSAVTLHNLGEAYSKMGQFQDSLDHYLRSLEVWRKADERRSASMELHYMATVFEYQGRHGAALNAREEALKTLRDLNDRSVYVAGVLSGYGRTLNQIGRFEEGSKQLEEAIALARQVKHQALIARILNYQSEGALYRGDARLARAFVEQARPVAEATQNSELMVLSKLNLAKVAIAERKPHYAAATLRGLATEAEAQGLKYIAAEASVSLGEALLRMGQVPQATTELQRILARSKKLGMQLLEARCHALLARTLRTSGDQAAAARHASEARRILDAIKKEAGSGDPLKRADLRAIYAETSE